MKTDRPIIISSVRALLYIWPIILLWTDKVTSNNRNIPEYMPHRVNVGPTKLRWSDIDPTWHVCLNQGWLKVGSKHGVCRVSHVVRNGIPRNKWLTSVGPESQPLGQHWYNIRVRGRVFLVCTPRTPQYQTAHLFQRKQWLQCWLSPSDWWGHHWVSRVEWEEKE